MDLLLPVISRWAHIGIAIILVGGTTFFRLVLLPSLEGDSTELLNRVRDRWKKFVHTGIAVFLISGFYNYIQAAGGAHKGDSLYHMLVGIKMLLAMGVFFLASALVGRGSGTQKFRDDAPKWTGIMLFISAVIIGISGFVKVRPYSPPAAAAESESTDSEESGTTPEPDLIMGANTDPEPTDSNE